MSKFIRAAVVVLLAASAQGELRTWTAASGNTLEAAYVRTVFDDVILRNADGEECRIPIANLSEADRKFIALSNPPELSIDFMRSSEQVHIDMSPFLRKLPPTVLLYRFGARVKQIDTRDYPYPLTAELYALSQQRYDPDKYHLIAKYMCEPFVLSDANGRRHEFMGEQKVKLIKYEIEATYIGWRETRGEKIAESLVIVRDERGEIIAYNTTKNWLYNNFDKLSELPVGAWLDNTCTRVHPTSPKDVRSGIPPH